ncbi:MAG: TRAP transporter small permease [Pseudomonadota bacterium]
MTNDNPTPDPNDPNRQVEEETETVAAKVNWLSIDGAYRAFRFLLDNVVGYGAALAMFLATWLAIFEVARRYIFGVVFPWGQDAVTYGLVGSVFLYFAVTQARRSHLRVGAGIEILERMGMLKTVLVIRAAISGMSMALFGGLAWWGIPAFERSMLMERTSQSMVLLIWPFQLVLIIAFALMAIVCLFQLYQDVQAVRGKRVFEWAPVEEGIDI